MEEYNIPKLPLTIELDTKDILKQLNRSNKLLAELKGIAHTIPNETILINSLTLQEAKESSEIENIVTTHDELYKADLNVKAYITSSATKEVLNYREAILKGFSLVRKDKLLTNQIIKQIQCILEGNSAGFRSIPGTTLKDSKGNIVYTPPQNQSEIKEMMLNLEKFINMDDMSDLDPLIKMAIIHHQFESIHPFYDGNGRTGRIICILYIVNKGLLDLPILYLSSYITQNKSEYYRLLQLIRDKNDNEKEWQDWILFMLKGIEETAQNTLFLVKEISKMMSEYKYKLRPLFGRLYKHELLNNLFFHPYTKIEYIERDMQVQRKSATKYLDMIVSEGLLNKIKIGRVNYYINTRLVELFRNHQTQQNAINDSVESVHETFSKPGTYLFNNIFET